MTPPGDLLHHLRSVGQDHLLAGFDTLTAPRQRQLLAQIGSIDFAQLAHLYACRDTPPALPAGDSVKPIAATERAQVPPEDLRAAERSLLNGELAVLLVAGGQGTRLGFDRPKGLYPVGPVSRGQPVRDPLPKGAGPAPPLRQAGARSWS